LTRSRSLNPDPALRWGKYRHYKGQLYEVIGIERHSETLEELVLYRPLYKNRLSALWVRPKKMFLENVKIDGSAVPRFEYFQEPA